MRNFRIFVNFKTYPQGTGARAVELAKICQEVDQKSGFQVIPIIQAVDIFRVKQEVEIPVWVQHADWQPPGKFTGWVNLEAVVEAGAEGVLLNHSEHPLPPGTIKQVISRIKNLKFKIKNFGAMICCKTLGQMERLVKFKPNFIGYEISELIGTENSIVDNVDAQTIKHALELCGKIPLILGAGINKPEDLIKAEQWQTDGVLISSAVVLAKSPKDALFNLVGQ